MRNAPRPSERRGGHEDEEGPAPGAEFGEDATDRGTDQRRDAPHAGGQREGPRPEVLGEDQPHHHEGQGAEEAAAEALHDAADEQHRHDGARPQIRLPSAKAAAAIR